MDIGRDIISRHA